MRIREIKWIDLQLYQDVLAGELDIGIFRGAINDEMCKITARNFWNHLKLKKRQDNVPSFEVGAHHFGQSLDNYFNEVQKEHDNLINLFKGTDNFLAKYQNFIRSYLHDSCGIYFRLASHQSRQASPFVMRSLSNQEPFQLLPHEDVAQLKEPLQKGFEIQKAYDSTLVSTNVCIENGIGGELVVWEYRPTLEDRMHMHVEYSGYPYLEKNLDEFNSYKIPVYEGDIYFLNGSLVHAVKSNILGARSIISFFSSAISKQEILYWS